MKSIHNICMQIRKLSLFLFLLVVSTAHADSRAELSAAYTKFNKAIKAKDAKACMAICTKDFTWKDKSGTKNRAESEAMLKNQFKFPFTVTKIDQTIGSFSEKNGVATVRAKSVMTARFTNPQTKKTSTIISTSESVDTWVKKGGAWLIKGVVEKKSSTTIDGKSISS